MPNVQKLGAQTCAGQVLGSLIVGDLVGLADEHDGSADALLGNHKSFASQQV